LYIVRPRRASCGSARPLNASVRQQDLTVVRHTSSAPALVATFLICSCASLRPADCKFDPAAIGVITNNINHVIAPLETAEITYDALIGTDGVLYKVQANGKRLRGWPFLAADDLTKFNGMCWVTLEPRSRDPRNGIFDGEGAAIIDPRTLVVAKTTWFQY
jgi:hypothetical protein